MIAYLKIDYKDALGDPFLRQGRALVLCTEPASDAVSAIRLRSLSHKPQATRPTKHAIVLADLKAKPSVAAQTRPALTSSARDGPHGMWSGREKAYGAVEQEKGA
jgi:hypothetical protein